MGFENRKSFRVKLDREIYFWMGAEASGPGLWAQAVNLSATGLALRCERPLAAGELLLLELSLPGAGQSLHVHALVVHCEREAVGQRLYQLRVKFAHVEREDRHLIRQYVLQIAEPDMGWGRAYFLHWEALDLKYKEIPARDRELCLEKKEYLSLRELSFLKKYQLVLEKLLSSKLPENFKLVGSRPLKEHCDIWMEFDLDHGQLHFLGKALWCRQDPGEKAECGVQLTAFHKDEAMKLERG